MIFDGHRNSDEVMAGMGNDFSRTPGGGRHHHNHHRHVHHGIKARGTSSASGLTTTRRRRGRATRMGSHQNLTNSSSAPFHLLLVGLCWGCCFSLLVLLTAAPTAIVVVVSAESTHGTPSAPGTTAASGTNSATTRLTSLMDSIAGGLTGWRPILPEEGEEGATAVAGAFGSSSATMGSRGGSSPRSVGVVTAAAPPSVAAAAAAAAAATSEDGSGGMPANIIRAAYQGEPGAYSEKATRELLGQKVIAVGRPSFEACFRAVASMECDYACLPIENSLGGSIHDNYDLMLRYDLTIIAEHDFRVHHCLLAKPGVKRNQIKYAISHPQALAQCDNFLRGLGITPIPTYDTAGSAKMIAEGQKLPAKCTPENTAAIASDLAGRTYGLDCLDVGIEDDDTNYTRFLLLARKGVVEYLTKGIPTKTSIVFTLNNRAGALYKALACFSLRDIDMSKIESRPTSASLLNFLKFKSQQLGKKSRNQADLPRFRYCFYLDFLASQLDENTQNALAHLREQADFMRILGSYPQKSRLVGPVAQSVEQLKHVTFDDDQVLSTNSLPSDSEDTKPLNIGIIGFDGFGQFLAKRLQLKHHVRCMDQNDRSKAAQKLGIEYFSQYETTKFLSGLDVVVLAVGLVDFEDAVQSLPVAALRGKLLVEMCVLNAHPKAVLLRTFGNTPDIDLVSSHPMFGSPVRVAGSGIAQTSDDDHGDPYADASSSWDGRPLVYEKVRISNMPRWEKFLKVFEEARCRLVEMKAEQHDASIADAEFVTHLTGRLLTDKQLLPPTPVISKEYAALCDVADMTAGDSFDLFFGMFKYSDRARQYITKMRESLATLERQLAAKEAYLEASQEMRNSDRQRLLAETKLLLREIANNGGLFDDDVRSSIGGTTSSSFSSSEDDTKKDEVATSSDDVKNDASSKSKKK